MHGFYRAQCMAGLGRVVGFIVRAGAAAATIGRLLHRVLVVAYQRIVRSDYAGYDWSEC